MTDTRIPINRDRLREGMPVYRGEGQLLGPIERIDADSITIQGQQYHVDSIERFEGDRVVLTRQVGASADRARGAAGAPGTAGAARGQVVEAEGQVRVPVREERLEVEKRPAELGAVEVRKTVETAGAAPTRDLRGRTVLAGLFTDRDEAVKAIDDLKAAGFRPEDVGVALRDRDAQDELVEDTGTKAAAGAATGALGGGALGGLVGFLVGLGALALPGLGPVVAGGALASAFGLAGGTAVAGAGIGAAAGGIVGALVGMGLPEEEAEYFERGFREGGVLVTVDARDRAPEALAIFERHGADTGPGAGA